MTKTTYTYNCEPVEYNIFQAIHELYRMNLRNEDLYIYMPDIYTRVFSDYLSHKYNHMPITISELRGIKIIPNYENNIVICHKDCVRFPELKKIISIT